MGDSKFPSSLGMPHIRYSNHTKSTPVVAPSRSSDTANRGPKHPGHLDIPYPPYHPNGSYASLAPSASTGTTTSSPGFWGDSDFRYQHNGSAASSATSISSRPPNISPNYSGLLNVPHCGYHRNGSNSSLATSKSAENTTKSTKIFGFPIPHRQQHRNASSSSLTSTVPIVTMNSPPNPHGTPGFNAYDGDLQNERPSSKTTNTPIDTHSSSKHHRLAGLGHLGSDHQGSVVRTAKSAITKIADNVTKPHAISKLWHHRDESTASSATTITYGPAKTSYHGVLQHGSRTPRVQNPFPVRPFGLAEGQEFGKAKHHGSRFHITALHTCHPGGHHKISFRASFVPDTTHHRPRFPSAHVNIDFYAEDSAGALHPLVISELSPHDRQGEHKTEVHIKKQTTGRLTGTVGYPVASVNASAGASKTEDYTRATSSRIRGTGVFTSTADWDMEEDTVGRHGLDPEWDLWVSFTLGSNVEAIHMKMRANAVLEGSGKTATMLKKVLHIGEENHPHEGFFEFRK
ncbi:hypothetical protein JAAARDRAFT_210214 [Jaapia argillacea MUCL 33604]|uniref:Uncharacterized protein n=1 Tax=Jaapia argillacea MUCL 33604 TaxID=933084 RepID=A0A067PNU0_9AGAM|nr:hypothetical protein JAAARDRAFT_210214 [Jaapia argillacea MUCL 33604]